MRRDDSSSPSRACYKFDFLAQWYSTWLSNEDAEDVAFDGYGFLGEGEAFESDNWCMSTLKFYEMNHRGHANNFVGVYIEDENCDATTETFPTFVRCSGAGAEIPDDGGSCSCGDGSTWNDATSQCECDVGYLATPYVSWRRNPVCIACNGIGATGKIASIE